MWAPWSLRSSPGELQIQRVARPRNQHLNALVYRGLSARLPGGRFVFQVALLLSLTAVHFVPRAQAPDRPFPLWRNGALAVA